MKKVLEFTGEPIGSGGQEMFIINMLRNIDDKELIIDWATPYSCLNDLYKSEVENRGGKIFCFNLKFNPGGSRINVLIPLYKFLKKNKYDVIHAHSGSISVLIIVSLVAKVVGIKKIIVHSHSTGECKNIVYKVLKLISAPFFLFFPTDFCACSEEAGSWKFPKSIVRRRLKVLKNGVDLRHFCPNQLNRSLVRKRLNVENHMCVIGHVGRFSYVKNQEFLIRIIYELKKRRCGEYKLLLIGEGETYDNCRRLVQELSLQDDVIFHGFSSCVYDYMQAMDIFLFPSRWEGLGLVAIEAQAVGLPVIASEAVPREMKLVDDVSFLSLDRVEDWVIEIEKKKGKRYEQVSTIKEKGYDIIDTAMQLVCMYK